MIGMALESCRKTIGGSASIGSRPRTRSSRVRKSSIAAFKSVPHVNDMRMLLEPSWELEFTCSSPATALTACSIGRVTICSIYDRHGVGVLPEDDRRVRVDRQPSAHAVQPRAQVVHRGVQIGAPRKRHANVARAFLGARVHLFKPRDGADGLFDRARDDLLHL